MAEKRLILWALAMATTTFLIAWFHPWGSTVPRDAAFGLFCGIAAQAWLPIAAILFLAGLWSRLFYIPSKNSPKSERFFQWLMAAWPIAVCLDCVALGWIGERLFSAAIGEIILNRLPSLSGHVTASMGLSWFAGFILFAGWLAGLSWWIGRLVDRWRAGSEASPLWIGTLATLAIVLINTPTILDHDTTSALWRQHASRQPWGMTGWLDVEPKERLKRSGVSAEQLTTATDRRLKQLRWNVVANFPPETGSANFPDVLILVLESLRPELIAADVMPNVHTMANQGVWMKRHHSGGNASSLGLFSLVSGLEAAWFYLAETRFSPAMNRLFRQAGYELGFFAGADDWDAFQMDAFFNADAFDAFEIEPRDWLASDRRAIAHAESFLDRTKKDASAFHAPRLAMLYLYSTHAPFDVDDQFVIDQPAASANYPIPFTPAMRPAIWNRYRNAARSIDDAIAELIDDPNRITLLVGDHGESFLDDGTIGHGTRCSAVQIQTPAILAGPGIAPQSIDDVTSHSDLLPTILSAAGIDVTRPDCFDGVDVLNTDHGMQRVISIADYLREQVLLIPSERSVASSFGWQCELSLRTGHAAVVGSVDEKGNFVGGSASSVGSAARVETGEANSVATPETNLLNEWLEALSR